jgi:hypothetical protein
MATRRHARLKRHRRFEPPKAGPQGEGNGWPEYFGFVFINRNGIRRLLILTERDPLDTRPQTFSPFK